MNRKEIIAVVLALLVFPVTSFPAAWARPTNNILPWTAAALKPQGAEEQVVVLAARPTVATVRARVQPIQLALAQMPSELETVSDVQQQLFGGSASAEAAAFEPEPEPVPEPQQAATAETQEEREAREKAEAAQREYERVRAASAARARVERLEQPDNSFDTRRLLTVWDRLEPILSRDPVMQATYQLLDREVKTREDVIAMFLKIYPDAVFVRTDPKYADPAELKVAQNKKNPLYQDFHPFPRWRTNPVGPEVKDLADAGRVEPEILSDIDHIPFDPDQVPDLRAREAEIKAAWKLRIGLALHNRWPWALGIAEMGVLSPVHKLGTYKKDGKYGAVVGMRNELVGIDAQEPVLRTWLPEVSLITELAFKCRNGFIAQTEMPTIHVESILPSCNAVQGGPTVYTSNAQKGNFKVNLIQEAENREDAEKNLEIRNAKWTVLSSGGSKVIATDTREVEVTGATFQDQEANSLSFTAEARDKTQENQAWYPVSCAVQVTKRLTPPSADCEALGTARLENGSIIVPFRVRGEADLVKKRVVTIDRQPVSESDVVFTKDSVVIRFDTIRNKPGLHTAGIRLLGEGEKILGECPGTVMTGVNVPGVDCASFKKWFDASKKRIRLSFRLLGDSGLAKDARIYQDGVLVDAKREKSSGSVWEFSLPDTIEDEAEHFFSVELIGPDDLPIGNKCEDKTPGTGLKKSLHCSCTSIKMKVFRNRAYRVSEHKPNGKYSLPKEETDTTVEAEPTVFVDETGRKVWVGDVTGQWIRRYVDKATGKAMVDVIGADPILKFRVGETVGAEGRTAMPTKKVRHHKFLWLGRGPEHLDLVRVLSQFEFVGITKDGKRVQCAFYMGVKIDKKPIIIVLVLGGTAAAIALTGGGAIPGVKVAIPVIGI